MIIVNQYKKFFGYCNWRPYIDNAIAELWCGNLGLASNPLANEARENGEFFTGSENGDSTLSITVVGASGDLAKKKIFPALFALFYEGFLPKVLFLLTSNVFGNWPYIDFSIFFFCYLTFLTWQNFNVFGYARTSMSDEDLRNIISRTLTCRIDQR